MPYKTRKVGDKYCVYKKHGGKKVGCTKGTEKAKKKYLAALHVNESFKFFFENLNSSSEDLKRMISNPDPERVKEYGGTKYVDMLKKKLQKVETIEKVEENIEAFIRKKDFKRAKGQLMQMYEIDPIAYKNAYKKYFNKFPSEDGEALKNLTKQEYPGLKKEKDKDISIQFSSGVRNTLSSIFDDILRDKTKEEDTEIDAADGAMKGIKAKERLNYIDNIMFTYPGKSLAFYKEALKKSSRFNDGKLTPYELFTIKREMKRQKQKKESTNLEENRAYVHNPRKIKAFINQVEKEFPKYKGEIKQDKDDQIVFPNDPKLIKFFKGAREVKFVLKDSVKLEEAEDRCKRKADQVYGKKTSAYKSGAIVRCRKGKIWKKK